MSVRKRSIEIYLKEGIEEDDLIYDVWTSLRGRGRPQDVFRRILRYGIRAMLETGELPRAAINKLDPELLSPMPLAHALLRAQTGVRQRAAAEQARAATRRAAQDPADMPPEPVAPRPATRPEKRPEPQPQAATPVVEPVVAAAVVQPVEPPRPRSKLGKLM